MVTKSFGGVLDSRQLLTLGGAKKSAKVKRGKMQGGHWGNQAITHEELGFRVTANKLEDFGTGYRVFISKEGEKDWQNKKGWWGVNLLRKG